MSTTIKYVEGFVLRELTDLTATGDEVVNLVILVTNKTYSFSDGLPGLIIQAQMSGIRRLGFLQ